MGCKPNIYYKNLINQKPQKDNFVYIKTLKGNCIFVDIIRKMAKILFVDSFIKGTICKFYNLTYMKGLFVLQSFPKFQPSSMFQMPEIVKKR